MNTVHSLPPAELLARRPRMPSPSEASRVLLSVSEAVRNQAPPSEGTPGQVRLPEVSRNQPAPPETTRNQQRNPEPTRDKPSPSEAGRAQPRNPEPARDKPSPSEVIRAQSRLSEAARDKLSLSEETCVIPQSGFFQESPSDQRQSRPLASGFNGVLAAHLASSLFQHVRAHGLGLVFAAGTGFLLAPGPHAVQVPAVAFLRRERAELLDGAEAFIPGAPDLVVEILDQVDPALVAARVNPWLRAGARMVVVLQARKCLAEIYQAGQQVRWLQAGEFLEGADVVPGWSLPLSDLFC